MSEIEEDRAAAREVEGRAADSPEEQRLLRALDLKIGFGGSVDRGQRQELFRALRAWVRSEIRRAK